VALTLNPNESSEFFIRFFTIVVFPAPDGAEKIIACPFPLGRLPDGILEYV
jgi:hypothetical protein